MPPKLVTARLTLRFEHKTVTESQTVVRHHHAEFPIDYFPIDSKGLCVIMGKPEDALLAYVREHTRQPSVSLVGSVVKVVDKVPQLNFTIRVKLEDLRRFKLEHLLI